MEVDALLHAIAIPVLIAAAVLFAARSVRDKCEWLAAPQLPAAALTCVVLAAFAQQSHGLPWRPHISFDWFPWGVVLVWCAASLLALWRRVDQSPHGSLLGGVAAATAFAVVAPAGLHLQYRALGAALCALAAWAQLRSRWIPREAQSHTGATVATAIGMWGSMAALSLLVLASGFAKLAVVLGAASAMAAALAAMAGVQRPLTLGTPTIAVWCTIQATAAMYGMGNDSGDVPTIAWLLAAASPLATAVVFLPPIARKPRLALCLRATLPPLVAAIALGVGRMSAPPPSSAELDYAQARAQTFAHPLR